MLHAVDTPDAGALLTAMTSGITAHTTIIVGVFGALVGLAFLFAIGKFIVAKVKGSVH